MKRPAVFFDRDNTLIACDEYLGDPEKVCLVEGAADAVARARLLGYVAVIFSNQSGVARGYFSEEAVHAVNQRLDEMLRDGNAKAVIDRHEFCPFHPDASIEKYRVDSPLRKPQPGMIHRAADALALDLSRSWVIGDAPRDVEAGHAAGCRTILFSDPSLKSSPAALAKRNVEPDYICSTLAEALDFIERNTQRVVEEEPEPAEAAPVDSPAPLESPAPDVASPSGERVVAESVHPAEQPAAEVKTQAAETTILKIGPAPQEEVAEPTNAAAPDPLVQTAPANALQAIRERDHHPAARPVSTAKLESMVNEIVHELRRQREQPVQDFSVSKLLAGVVQVIVLFVLFLAFLNRADTSSVLSLLLFALTLQAMTIALLIMGRQR